jgi:hypothetical protein
VLLVVLTALVLSSLTAVATAPHVSAGPADEQAFLGLINGLRSARGLGPLTVDANLTQLAQQHTVEMANGQHLEHTSALAAGVTTPWQKLGENVGFGSNLNLVWNAFLNSPGHLANLVDPAYNAVGIGVTVDGNGILWTTHRFMQTATPAPPPFVPPPAPRPPVTAPRPAPVPAPVAVPQRPQPVVTVPATAPPTTVAEPPPPVAEPEPTLSPAVPDSVASLLDALHQTT